MTPREGGGGNFTHRICSLLSTFCLHSQNYPRIRMLLWEDSKPRPTRRQPRAWDEAPSDPRRHPPSTGVSERHLRKSTANRGRLLSCSWGRQELGKTFFRGCLKWSSRGRAPGSVVWQRGALLLEVPLSLEEPVLLGPPEGLRGSRGSGWGAPVTVAASVTGSIHSSCVWTCLVWTEGLW